MGRVTVGRVNSPIEGVTNIKIDRSSPLGNPFYISMHHDRDAVCEQYAKYFEEEVKHIGSAVNQEFMRILELVKQGNNINLQCWCNPKRCHGDTIKRWLDHNV